MKEVMDIEHRLMMKPQDAVTQAETLEAVSTIIQLRQQLAAALAACEAKGAALQEVVGLIGESSGVYGLHLNGDNAPWEEVEQGGRFERLTSLCEALAVKPDSALDQYTAQIRNDFCAAINHAISLGVEGSEFLRCWNEGDWKGCAEFGFTPSDTLKGKL